MKLFLGIYLLATVCVINSIPYGALADDMDNKRVLIFTPANIASTKIGRYDACVRIAMEECNTNYDLCMLDEDGQRALALRYCYDQLVACYGSCDDDYAACCAPYEDRVCPEECRTIKTGCYATCQDVGAQCQLDAINYPYEPPVESECFEDWNVCVEVKTDLCSTL